MQSSVEIIPSVQTSLPILPIDSTMSGAFSRNAICMPKQFFLPGQVLDGMYEIRRLIGRGGMGEVYEARDRVLSRVVAIKVAKRDCEMGSLIREARAMAKLRGQGVPNVFAMGTFRGHEYCVMERVYGTTLSRQIRGRLPETFSVTEVMHILEGAAEALSSVHRAGMIHRDLKPSNIMLAPKQRVVLIDFGLFRSEGSLWAESEIWGSPRYIAPETITHQIKLGQEHLIDIYALGVIGFCMLVGCPPFNSKSVSRILSKHVEQRPPRISYIRPDVPEALDRLVLSMLSKDPSDRPRTAEEIVAHLRAMAS